MQNDETIECPECHKQIPLTSALSEKIKHQLQVEFNEKSGKQNEIIRKKVEELQQREAQIKKEQESVSQLVEQKLKDREAEIKKAAEKKAQANQEVRLKDLEERNASLAEKVTTANTKELDLLRQKRALEDKQKELELEVEKKLQAGQDEIYKKATEKAQEEMRNKLHEKDKQLEIMSKSLETAKRQAEQGSMQIQGEIQEDNLKKVISASFPFDVVEDVPTGIKGGDLVHTVRSDFGQKCGVILWESKNTKAWSDDWIKKLKDDRGLVEADACVLVTQTLPSDIVHFGLKDSVWVTEYKYALPLVSTLRVSLQEISLVKSSMEGRDEKIEQLFNYVSGTQFRHRIENIVGAFESLQLELNAEKRAMERIWARRTKEIDRVITNTTGLYGDLQGIASNTLPTISSLELLPAGEEDFEHAAEEDQVGPV